MRRGCVLRNILVGDTRLEVHTLDLPHSTLCSYLLPLSSKLRYFVHTVPDVEVKAGLYSSVRAFGLETETRLLLLFCLQSSYPIHLTKAAQLLATLIRTKDVEKESGNASSWC